MDEDNISLAPFMDMVEDALADISHNQLKANLMEYARDLPPNKRFEFFQILTLHGDEE